MWRARRYRERRRAAPAPAAVTDAALARWSSKSCSRRCSVARPRSSGRHVRDAAARRRDTNELVRRAAASESRRRSSRASGSPSAGASPDASRPKATDDPRGRRPRARPQPDPAGERDRVDARRALVVGGKVRGVLHVGTLIYATSRRTRSSCSSSWPTGRRSRSSMRALRGRARGEERIEHVQAVTDAALAHLEVNELLAVLLPRIRHDPRAPTPARSCCSTRRRTSSWRARPSGSRRRWSRACGSRSAAASPGGSPPSAGP